MVVVHCPWGGDTKCTLVIVRINHSAKGCRRHSSNARLSWRADGCVSRRTCGIHSFGDRRLWEFVGPYSEVRGKEGASLLSPSSAVYRRGGSGEAATPVGIPTTQWSFPWAGNTQAMWPFSPHWHHWISPGGLRYSSRFLERARSGMRLQKPSRSPQG